jgi:uncharacterized UBP type Zn finger protein
MDDRRVRTHLTRALAAIGVGIGTVAAALLAIPAAHADVVGYLVNVTMRPGYNFANADAALAYGNGICEKIAQGRTYGELMAEVKSDFGTTDEFHATYLIGQSADQLCPAMLSQLRNSAAGYRPSS